MTQAPAAPPRYSLWAELLILAGLVYRFWCVASGQLNLVQDEAQYWDWTRHIQLTYYSKGPLVTWIIKAGTMVFGDTELGVRLGSILGAAAFQGLLYLAPARLWQRPDLGFWAVAVVASSPLFLALGILMTTDNPFVLCWTGAMFCLWAAGEGGGGKSPYMLLALCLGFGLLAKYTMLGFLGLAVAYGLYLEWKSWRPRRFWPRLVLALGAGLALGFLPTFVWNFQNDFVGYKHVLYLIGVEGKGAERLLRLDCFPEYFGSQMGLLTPWWLWLMLAASLAGLVAALRAPARAQGLEATTARRQALLVIFFLPVWSFFLLWSFHAKTLPNWSTVSYVAGAFLTAERFVALVRNPARLRARNFLLALSAFIFLVLHLSPVLPLPPSVDILGRLKGWSDMGRKADELRQGLPDPARCFFLSDVYDTTAELAFYVPGQPRAFCVWADDRRMNQYDLWPGPQEREGQDAIFVRKGLQGPLTPKVAALFAAVSEPIHFYSEHRGRLARSFTFYVCIGYNGVWYSDHSGRF